MLTGITGVACREDAVEPHGLTSAAVKARDVVARSTSGRESTCGSCLTDLAKGSIASWMLANYCTHDGRSTLSTRGERDNRPQTSQQPWEK